MHRLALAGALALVLSSAAYADTPATTPAPATSCYTEAALASDAAAHKQVEVGAIQFRSDHADEMVVVQGDSSLIAFFFKGGCLVNMVAVDTVTPDKGA